MNAGQQPTCQISCARALWRFWCDVCWPFVVGLNESCDCCILAWNETVKYRHGMCVFVYVWCNACGIISSAGGIADGVMFINPFLCHP